MARKFVVVDRQTPLMLPPSLQDWVEKDDIVHLIIDTVDTLEESSCHFNWKGTGSSQYPPRMMLALLIYCYSCGIFSSRRIENATRSNVSVRFITADTHPDHDTIAAFRRENEVLFKACFVRVLSLARKMKVGRVGDIAIDGSVIEANASKRRTMTQESIHEELLEVEEKVTELTRRAESIDKEESSQKSDPERLPRELVNAQARKALLSKALKELEAFTGERARQREEERAAFDREGPGQPAAKLPAQVEAGSTVNLTDTQARLLKTKSGGSAPAYNVQIAVQADTDAPLIVARSVNADANDRRQTTPMSEKTMELWPETQRIITDTGYDNSAQIAEVEKKHRVVIFCPPAGQGEGNKNNHRVSRKRQRTENFRQAMKTCLKSTFGRKSQRLRATTVEPVFGWIKYITGFRRFHLRGLAKVNLEWDLVCLSYNFAMLARQQNRPRTA